MSPFLKTAELTCQLIIRVSRWHSLGLKQEGFKNPGVDVQIVIDVQNCNDNSWFEEMLGGIEKRYFEGGRQKYSLTDLDKGHFKLAYILFT